MVLYHMRTSHLLTSFFNSTYGRQLDKKDRDHIKKLYDTTSLGAMGCIQKTLNDPFSRFLTSLHLGEYSSSDFLNLIYERYLTDGISGCKTLLSLASYCKTEPHTVFDYANIHERLYGHKLTMAVIKEREKMLACTPGQLFSSYTLEKRAWSDKSMYFIEKPHCDTIQELCGSNWLPVYLHGNPYRNQKFYSWLLKHQHDPAWYRLQKNVDSLNILLSRIMNGILSEERTMKELFRQIFLKNRDDVLRLMQPMPLLDQLIDMHPLFEYREHNIRDLFFQEEVSHRGPKHRVYRPDMEAFEAFRTYFIEEAEGLLYEPLVPDDTLELFF